MSERRALMVLTRDPGGEVSGRKSVLATAARSLEALGWTVDVAVLARQPPAPVWQGRRVRHVRLPGVGRVLAGTAGAVVRRHRALNEVLFDSGRVRREVRRIATGSGARLVVADTLRTAGPAGATGLPLVVHLDDLLSERYRAMAGAGQERGDVLGFFGAQLPGGVRHVAERLAGRLLAVEARLVARRELEVARTAGAVAMTSPEEAAELQRRSGRVVDTLPMAVDVRPPADVASAPATSMVFVGLMSYTPNAAAVRWWVEHVRPALDRAGGSDVTLTVVGSCTPAQRAELGGDERLVFTGYVPDLAAELRRHRALLAPITRGTGMKTKVLDGFSVALPVVATPLGVSGLVVQDGEEVLVSDTAEGLAQRVLLLRDDPDLAAAVGARGRDLLARTWSTDHLVQGWGRAVDRALAAAAPGSAAPPDP